MIDVARDWGIGVGTYNGENAGAYGKYSSAGAIAVSWLKPMSVYGRPAAGTGDVSLYRSPRFAGVFLIRPDVEIIYLSRPDYLLV